MTFAHPPPPGPHLRWRRGSPRHEDGTRDNIEAALEAALAALDAAMPDKWSCSAMHRGLSTTRGTGCPAPAQAGVLASSGSGARRAAELGVLSLTLPGSVKPRQPFGVQARLFASQPARVRVRLLRDGKPEPDQQELTLSLVAGETTVSWRSQAPTPGHALYRVELRPEGAERLPDNNTLERSLRVRKPRACTLSASAIVAALRELLEAPSSRCTSGPEGPLEARRLPWSTSTSCRTYVAALPQGRPQPRAYVADVGRSDGGR